MQVVYFMWTIVLNLNLTHKRKGSFETLIKIFGTSWWNSAVCFSYFRYIGCMVWCQILIEYRTEPEYFCWWKTSCYMPGCDAASYEYIFYGIRVCLLALILHHLNDLEGGWWKIKFLKCVHSWWREGGSKMGVDCRKKFLTQTLIYRTFFASEKVTSWLSRLYGVVWE
jgi:hypothetical protein